MACCTLGAAAFARDILVDSFEDSGLGTLRAAIEQASRGDRILFDPAVFPPTEPVEIVLISPLPPLETGDVTIDASDASVILTGRELPDT